MSRILMVMVSLAILLAGCVFELDSIQRPCIKGSCGQGKVCVNGACLGREAGTADDMGSDARDAAPDRSSDVTVVDRALETGLPDKALPDAAPPDVTPADQALPDQSTTCAYPNVSKSCSSGWCSVTAGCFMMGLHAATAHSCSPKEGDEEHHQVTLTKSFVMMEAEVTQGEYMTQMGITSNPFGFPKCGSTCPAESVNWHQAVAYCNSLTPKSVDTCYTCSGSGKTTKCTVDTKYKGTAINGCPGTRLPTEAEWEYAYRASPTPQTTYNGGFTGIYCKGCCSGLGCTTLAHPYVEVIAWHYCNSTSTPHPVKQKNANGWGLRDMAGNVAEWVHDKYKNSLGTAKVTDPCITNTSQAHVIKGGSWKDYAEKIRAMERSPQVKTMTSNTIGFRCVRPPAKP